MKELKFNNNKKVKKVKKEELSKYKVRKRVEELKNNLNCKLST
ncbi:hypothetical protein [Vibrio campbellii]|nr:hypothetical protein [Vibrio campbellii]